MTLPAFHSSGWRQSVVPLWYLRQSTQLSATTSSSPTQIRTAKSAMANSKCTCQKIKLIQSTTWQKTKLRSGSRNIKKWQRVDNGQTPLYLNHRLKQFPKRSESRNNRLFLDERQEAWDRNSGPIWNNLGTRLAESTMGQLVKHSILILLTKWQNLKKKQMEVTSSITIMTLKLISSFWSNSLETKKTKGNWIFINILLWRPLLRHKSYQRLLWSINEQIR